MTETHELPVPEKYINNPDYYETGKTIRKQRVVIEMSVKVIEYTAKEYRSRVTGARVHAPFPPGYANEVNYDRTVKALAFLLSNECNVSHGRIRTLLSELTDGKVELSDGMLNHLSEESALKSRTEKKEITSRLTSSPVIVADFESRYNEILDKAKEEYEASPPSDYYQEGYNLSVRLREYKENELLFLHDKRVPANNSLCERLAQVYKRKQKQAMVLRSQKKLGYICDGLSTVHLLRTDDRNVYQEIATIFERKSPQKPKKEVEANVLT